VQIKAFLFPDLLARLASPGAPFDLGYYAWETDFPDPYGMLNQLLGTSALYPPFDASSWQRKLAATARLSGPERYLAYGKLRLGEQRRAAARIRKRLRP
jgi:hypothetical protein